MGKNVKNRKLKVIFISLLSSVCFFITFMLALYFALGYYLFTFSLDATFASVSNIPKNVDIEIDLIRGVLCLKQQKLQFIPIK